MVVGERLKLGGDRLRSSLAAAVDRETRLSHTVCRLFLAASGRLFSAVFRLIPQGLST